MQSQAAAANQKLADDALDEYVRAHGDTVDPAALRALSNEEMGAADADVGHARAAAPDAGHFIVESGGRVLVVDIDVHNRQGCGTTADADYRMATAADGTPVVIRRAFTRRTTARVEQCGVCTKGCGAEPYTLPWLGWALPVPPGTHTVIEEVPVTFDELDVTCERELPAE